MIPLPKTSLKSVKVRFAFLSLLKLGLSLICKGKGQRGGKAGRSRGGFRTDRHSNTARTDSDKQEHQGWGINDDGKRELADEQNGWEDAKADESAVATPREAVSPTPAEASAPAEKEPVVEEEPTKTYDEYLAERNSGDLAEKLGLQNLSLRKANEGADDAQWKNAKEYAREDEDGDAFFAGNKVRFYFRAVVQSKLLCL